MIEIITATRKTENEFWNDSALGISLRRLSYDSRLSAFVAFKNQVGLPVIYNSRITAENTAEFLVFTHDDVWIDDYFLIDRVIEGLKHFDIVGVAGNIRRVDKQPAWLFLQGDDGNLVLDKENLSGSVGHGPYPFGNITFFGKVPMQCELMDGVFLAVRKETLLKNNIFFDPIFDFHFYDMDFCRTARKAGLVLGTWSVCITHQSSGAFGVPKWQEKYSQYLQKWTR